MFSTVFVLVAVLCISVFYLAPTTVRTIGSIVGWYLRRRTADRRAIIVERVQTEEAEYAKIRHGRNRPDEEGWETVDSYGAMRASNGAAADSEWEGIVGFFHPFW